MNPSEDKVVFNFIDRLKNSVPDSLSEVILYGSRARGDFKEFSDYDFLVVHTQDKNSVEIQNAILDAEVGIMDEFEELVSSIFYTKPEWEKKKKYPLGLNIQREGITVWIKN
jgi:uncharacterized protein